METIVAVAACILVGIQAHRNYLMVQARKQVPVAPVVEVTVPPAMVSIPAPRVVVESSLEIDYVKLAEAFKAQLPVTVNIPSSPPTYIPNPTPFPGLPSPTWVAETVTNEMVIKAASGIEVPVKKF